MKIKITWLVFILLLLASCQSEPVNEVHFLEKELPTKEKLELLLSEENKTLLQLDDETFLLLQNYYKSRKFKPLWSTDSVLTFQGTQLEKIAQHPIIISLPSNRFFYPKEDSTHPLLKELYLTSMLFKASYDIGHGYFDTLKKSTSKPQFISIDEFEHLRENLGDSLPQIAQNVLINGYKDTLYTELAKQHVFYCLNSNLTDQNFAVVNEKSDSLKSLNFAKKSLISKKYLSDTIEIDIRKALINFQLDNGLKPDGVIGQTTADALNETCLEKMQRSALVLEKLRQRKRADKRFIEVNIPEFTLRFYCDDTLKSVHRIIVGKPENQTPELQSQLHSIITLPYWNVPQSICNKEILPDARKNPNYFARNNMKIYRKDKEVDPLSVNWHKIKENAFPYKVVQQPGPSNSLGIIKFDFNNKYGVYFHDTPQKRLFNTVIRAYSHGCMRCENPDTLAKLILWKDGNKISPDTLDSLLMRHTHKRISLKKRIPIFVEYRSVVIRDGKLVFLRDIYRRDRRLAKFLFKEEQKSS